MKKPSRESNGAPVDPNPRCVARLSAAALKSNYRAISRMVPHQRVIPMIKANAYGHGAVWAAETLKGLPGLYGFGVATLEEALELRTRAKIPARLPVLVFSGFGPFNEERTALCVKHGLTPVISSAQDLKAFINSRFATKLPYELKFNTGMNRLGVPAAMAPELASIFSRKPKLRPRGVLSHLASAETPTGEHARSQLGRFVALRSCLSGALEGFSTFHLANSSAIWHAGEYRLRELTGAIRPGLSLYGVPPWSGAQARGIRPVMNLEARVLDVHVLQEGDLVGYGGTFRARRGTRVAVLAAGYADGIHRAFSGRGVARLGERSARFAGIVSMDLSALELPSGKAPKLGSYARLLGEGIEPWEQASLAGTVPYELLTSVPAGPRVQKIYG